MPVGTVAELAHTADMVLDVVSNQTALEAVQALDSLAVGDTW